MGGRGIAVALLLGLVAARAEAKNAELARAEQLMEDLRYPEAARALAAARLVTGNDRPTLLRILELQGIIAASLGNEDAALQSFRLLVTLDPEHTLRRKFGPKVMTPFYAAKGWVAEHGALRFGAGAALLQGKQVEAIIARLPVDPLKVGRKVRFHILEGEGAPREVEVSLQHGAARVQQKGEPVKWWAELLGDQDAVLALVGSGEKPVVDSATRPSAEESPREPALAEEEGVSHPLELTPRTMSYVVLGGAVVALGVGSIFGVQSARERSAIQNAATDSAGRVVGLTQRQAVALDGQARQNAVVANILFASSGALAVAGGVLWWQGTPVTVTPTGQGVAIAGVLP